MKKCTLNLIRISSILLLWGISFTASTQSTENFFGMNYWEYAEYAPGQITDEFEANKTTLESWNINFVRIGGNYNNTSPQGQNKEWYDRPIQNALSMGAIPLVQLPIDLSPTEVSEWMDYFNITRGYNIKYWAIGNEPDPSNGLNEWYTGAPGGLHDGRNYTGFRGQFRILARKIKEKDPNSIVCGPDFRMWYGSASDASSAQASPFGTYYRDFLYDGSNPVGTDTYNGDQLIDIFVLHFYGDGGSADFDEGDYIEKYGQMMQLINATNAQRPDDQQLKIAVGEFNDANPKGFRAGQRMAIMAKQSLKNGAVFMTPWAISEGTDFYPMISKENGDIYSTAYHWEMMSQNKRGTFMDSQENSNDGNNIVSFGMKDASGYTIMLINEGPNEYTFSVNFSETAGAYNPANTALKFRFDATEPAAAFSGVTLFPNSTILYTYNNEGQRLQKIEYRAGYTAPTVYNFPDVEPTTSFSVNFTEPVNTSYQEGDNISVTVGIDPAPATQSDEYSVQLFSSFNCAAETLVRTENLAPYEWPNDFTNLAAGNYNLRALATKVATGETEEANFTFLVNGNMLSGFTGKDYQLVNELSGNYLKPLNGSATEVIILENQTSPPPAAWLSFQWYFEDSGFVGNYHIFNKNTGKNFRPTGGSVEAGTNMEQMDAPNDFWESESWIIEPSNVEGYYWIKNRKSGLYLRPADGSQISLAELVQDPLVPSYGSFRWQFVEINSSAARNEIILSNNASGLITYSIYPNPAKDKLYISESVKWNLFDLSGNKISTGEGKEINLKGLQTGVYLVKANDDSHRIIIE